MSLWFGFYLREHRERTLIRNPDDLCDQLARPLHLHKYICQRRIGLHPFRDHMKISKQIIVQWPAMCLVILMHEFVFQLRHIHTARTFRSASLASEAKVKRGIDRRRQTVDRESPIVHRLWSSLSIPATNLPATRAKCLIPRRLKRRAHHTCCLSANSLTVTMLNRASQTMLMFKM